MMVKEVANIQENEILASPVYLADGEILIPKGTVLKTEYLDLLTSLNITTVEIEDKYSSYGLPRLLISEEKWNYYVKCIQSMLENHIYRERSSLSSVKELALELLEDIEEIELDAVYDILYRKSDLYEHTLKVTIFSILVAKKLKISKEKYYAIAVGALLHDLGLRYITVPYINQRMDELTPEEVFEYKKHTILAYTVLDGEEEWLPNISKNMILSHHEKMDASGFPLKQKNQDIECRIIQVCDSFDCLISGIGCKSYSIDIVIDYIRSKENCKYDKMAAEALFSFVAKYPVKTIVILSDGRFGIVANQTSLAELPVINILTDLDGDVLNEAVNLKDNRNIHISKTI